MPAGELLQQARQSFGTARDQFKTRLDSLPFVDREDDEQARWNWFPTGAGSDFQLTKTLEPRCKRVEQARSAIEAAAILDQSHFDLVILDNIMPGKTGLDFLKEQRRLGFFADLVTH